MPEKDNYGKIIFLYVFTAILAFLILIRLVDLQVINGAKYAATSESRLVRSVRVSAPRGEILDRNGKTLVTNRIGFAVQLQKTAAEDEELNSTILSLISLMDTYGQKYTDTLQLNGDGTAFTFDAYEGEKRDKKIVALCKDFKVKEYSANAFFDALCKKYGISDSYNVYEKRRIMGVRYEMTTRNFSISNPYIFAPDVDMSVIMILKERSMEYPGVNIITNSVREYAQSGMASHILGRVGIIYREEYEKLKDENYGMNDIIGKDGMEKYLEKYVRGKDGRSSVEQTIQGKTALITDEVAPIAGNNAMLTIDTDVQQAAEASLARTIQSLRGGNGRGSGAAAGACVAVDVNTGEILAIANYPTFDLKTFDEDYATLYKDPRKPMFNRAVSGAYEPGSTFKMLTSIAALEEGVITPYTRIEDKGVYEYYGQRFNCWIYTDTGKTHGSVNVSDAIRDSCNFFFYDVGRQLGVDKLVSYGRKIGLGEYTGIEIEGETKGTLANPQYKEKVFDQQWFPGDTLQMSIGQSFNLFSPLQLAGYTATLANGGTRYKLRLLKNVRDRQTGEETVSGEPEVLGSIKMKDTTKNAISLGMRKVCQEGGTAASVFGNYPIEVCAKTGSAQVSRGAANGVFVAFAPYKDPQIAVAVVIENAGSGNSVAPVARDVFDAYFKVGAVKEKDNFYNKNSLLP